MNPLLKFAVEIAPLAVFFIGNSRYGIMTATAAFMVATAVALAISWSLTRRLPMVPLVTGIIVLGFGGLTLLLDDETFIKLKPTIVNTLFGTVLIGGLAFRRPLLKPILDAALQLTDTGWRKLSLRWAIFFFILAILNEVVWRNFSTDTWVDFKVFGIMPLTVLFTLSQVPLIQRYQLDEGAA